MRELVDVRELSTTRRHAVIRKLTERQLIILPMIADGLTNGEIGKALHLAESTVKSHVRDLVRRLGARDRTQAVTISHELGLLGSAVSSEARIARIRVALAKHGQNRGNAPAGSRFAQLYDDMQAAVDLRSP